jgi:hypothetical protein
MERFLKELAQISKGCPETDVARLLQKGIFPATSDSNGCERIKISHSVLIPRHFLPHVVGSQAQLSQPKPVMLYGYSSTISDGTFTHAQIITHIKTYPKGVSPDATNYGLCFPFLSIEIKSSLTAGGIWAATNQCAGSATACLKAIEHLNRSLPASDYAAGAQNLAYCVATDNNYAELLVAWKADDAAEYFMQRVETFVLSRPEEVQKLRGHVCSIIDWGKGPRLEGIRRTLDAVAASQAGKPVGGHAKKRKIEDDIDMAD